MKQFSGMMLAAVTLAILPLSASSTAQSTPRTERRCGWLDNPTPANWWLTDRHGEWLIGAQGGYQAAGMDTMPDMSTRGWVRTNGYYGYGCACMTVTSSARTMRIIRIVRAAPVPIAQCRNDRALPRR